MTDAARSGLKKRSFRMRILCLLLCGVWLLGTGVVPDGIAPVQAEETLDDLNAQLDQLAKEQDEIQKKLDESTQNLEEQKEKAKNLQLQIVSKGKEISVNEQILSKLDGQIAEKEAIIATHEATIQALDEQMDEQYQLLRERLRAISKKGAGATALQLLLSSQTYRDYLINRKVSECVSAHDQALMDALDANIRTVEAAKAETEAAKAELETERKQQADALADLEAAQASLKSLHADALALEQQMLQDKTYLEEQKAALDAKQSSLQSTVDDILARLEKEDQESGNTPPSAPTGTMTWPTPTCRVITSSFKYRPQFGRWHKGLDIACYGDAEGEPIVAAADGTVVFANRYDNWGGGYGLYLMIDHGRNANGQRILTVYAHCCEVTAYEGLTVKAGDRVGYVGNTGNSFGAHLHFEVQVDGTAVDPVSGGYLSTSGIHILG